MTVALTGGSGFLGAAILRVARARGAHVRALFRQATAAAKQRAAGVEPHVGDLLDAGSLAGFVQPGDVVVHAAARVDLTTRWEDYVRGTIDTTRTLLDAALPARPAKFVYVSSAAVYGRGGREPLRADRSRAAPPGDMFYARAKLAAERLVAQRCAAAGVPWAAVRLSFLYGPGNAELRRSLTRMQDHKRLFIVGPGANRIATLHIDDAAEAVWAAAHAPESHGVYDAASDEHVTQEQFVNVHTAQFGLPHITIRFPAWMSFLFAGAVEWAAARRGATPFVTRAMVRLMSADQVVDAGRLQRECGWRARRTFAAFAAARAAAGDDAGISGGATPRSAAG